MVLAGRFAISPTVLSALAQSAVDRLSAGAIPGYTSLGLANPRRMQ
jgi:hypothetical protein